jgi:murein DD-endopeptidase MepM/ murein hydrolase activator NlpD
MKKLYTAIWLFAIVFSSLNLFGQEGGKKKLEDDFEQYKKNRSVDFQDFKKKREAELKKMQEDYQNYYNEMTGLKKYYTHKKDTLKAKVVDDIISYEKTISQALGKPLKVTEEVKFESKSNNEPVRIETYTPGKIENRIKVEQKAEDQKTTDKQQNETQTVKQPEVVSQSIVDNQPRNEETASTSNISPCLTPLPKTKALITSPFGMRNHPTLGRPVKHNGIDFGSGMGTEIYAADKGKVVVAEFNSSFGNYIVIEHRDGQSSTYAHLSKLEISKGETVAKGQLIGYSGSTGRSTGAHLHYEVRVKGTPVNPKDYLLEYK